jgi:GTPase SAR1 family protein
MSENIKSHKIILAGLDSAGKTSIYKKIMEGAKISELENLPPTRGISRNLHKLDEEGDENVIIWDLGGQERYRNEYLVDTHIFRDSHTLIYVFDIQDEDRFDISLDYFLKILDILKEYNPKPNVFALLHKLDPEKESRYRIKVFDAIKKFKEVNKYEKIKIVNYSTSIYSDTIEYAFKKIFEQLFPKYMERQKEKIDEMKRMERMRSEEDLPQQIGEEKISPIVIESEPDLVTTNINQGEKTLFDYEEKGREELDHLLDDLEFTTSPQEEQKIRSRESVEYDLIKFQSKLLEISRKEADTSVERTIQESVQPLITALIEYLGESIKKGQSRGIISASDSELVQSFIKHFAVLGSEFWNFIDQEKLKSFEIGRKLPLLIEKLFNRVLKAARINDLISMEERSRLKGIYQKLVFQL